MSPLLFFFFVVTVAAVSYLLGHQIGYLSGKREVSHIMRGEPP